MMGWIPYLIYIFSGILLMSGVAYQVKGALDKGQGIKSSKSLVASGLKISGFCLLAYVIFQYKMQGFWLGIALFFISSALTILFYLLARHRSIR